jgi:CheY-like chemotaxis protein
MEDALQKRILVVDDEEDIRLFLETLFADNGYAVLTAADGEEGLEILKDETVDLITLDLMMPNETGTQMYRRLHRDPRLAEIPVIVISGVAGRHLAVREPVAVFDKPIDEEALLETVRRTIG